MATAPRSNHGEPASPRLRLLVNEELPAGANQGSWTLLFGALSASAGHGLFLAVALTRLRSLPSRAELGGWLDSAVLLWFVACVPLALAAGLLRRRVLTLAPARARGLATAATALAILAFALYLRAVAL